jgi:hypothetical protein
MKIRTGLAIGAASLGACGLVIAGVAAGVATASPAATARPAATTQPRTLARHAAQAATAAAPTGFWGGTDSNYMSIPGPKPYREPVIGGSYGGYIGMIGNWAAWQGCGGEVVWSKTDSRDARTNYVTYNRGIGVGAYWFMGGPGVDPHYNGRLAEASDWGAAQAKAALADLAAMHPAVTYPVVFMDVEIPGDAPRYTPASDNGWNSVYTSPCSGRVRKQGIPADVSRAEFNGFADYLTSHSSYKAGVYSAPSIWTSIFGTGSAASLPNTYEWTYTNDSASLSHHPSHWCLAGTKTCAEFFGGMSSKSKYAVMWQWSGGGGTYNGYGDFDQIDASRTP